MQFNMLWCLLVACVTYIPEVLDIEQVLRLNNDAYTTLLRLDELDGKSSITLSMFALGSLLQILIFLMLVHPARISKRLDPKKKRIWQLAVTSVSILAACFYAAGISLSIAYAGEFRLFKV